jgi:hypothetical protein
MNISEVANPCSLLQQSFANKQNYVLLPTARFLGARMFPIHNSPQFPNGPPRLIRSLPIQSR